MAVRYYVSDIVGSGTAADPFHPALKDVVSVNWSGCDLRADDSSAGGKMLVWCDTTTVQHTLLTADVRITYLPFEDLIGMVLGIASTLGDVSAANRTLIASRLGALSIPMQDLLTTDLLKKVIARIVRRVRIRRALDLEDFTEGLDTLVSDIPSERLAAIAARLQVRGYDSSVVIGTDTIRQALVKLAVQDVPWQTNEFDV